VAAASPNGQHHVTVVSIKSMMLQYAISVCALCLQAATAAEPWPSVAELEQEGVSQLLQSEAAGQLQQRYTYLYSSAPDLRMDDIPVLLRQYKELILKHEALVSAIEAHRASQQSGAVSSQPQPTPAASQDYAGWRLLQ
jgi:hypothetical protein